MLKRFGVFLLILALLAGCGHQVGNGKLSKVGLLVPETVNDQVWGTKGYNGMLKIQSELGAEVYYKEGMDSSKVIEEAIEEFSQKGISLIFGHGNEYAEYFNDLADQYPDIHFVSFNGNAKQKNTTSINFNGYAMGFFGGMVAAHMSKTNSLGVIAAYEWQPEVEGFYDGALYENKQVNVSIQYVGNWDDQKKALDELDFMLENNIDVVYPAGDGFNVPVIEKVKENSKFAIGYVSDQSDLGESTVLTSTVQNVEHLYELVAEQYVSGELKSGNQYYDFQDDVIMMGEFSPLIDKSFVAKLNVLIDEYMRTGKLPNEK
ncbi:BMP family ABC transporter substrate-binding protein [Bacillus marasmi]|uniref:BMP family ABC transporter substrate-binding protein n=1 Tax=Bacillus marasmi TaxID=1926279 RepID=UPI0011CB1A08|nr:BMP family ABC transporter substrate-binding protein [Bacillus marasmi]